VRYSFLEPAKQELEEAIAHFEQQQEDLGAEFALEVNNAIQRIIDFPEAWPSLSATVRCCRTKRFLYGIVYTIREKEILIVAVMHLHRKPRYWKDRL
jgi:plasmid stabilization system protein ParE